MSSMTIAQLQTHVFSDKMQNIEALSPLIQKAKNMVPLLVPLFISAFRRANDLAMAMEARCYHGGDNRTQMKPLCYKKRDHMAYVILAAYLAVAIGFRAAGI